MMRVVVVQVGVFVGDGGCHQTSARALGDQ
jgi:hypothetical protein